MLVSTCSGSLFTTDEPAKTSLLVSETLPVPVEAWRPAHSQMSLKHIRQPGTTPAAETILLPQSPYGSAVPDSPSYSATPPANDRSSRPPRQQSAKAPVYGKTLWDCREIKENRRPAFLAASETQNHSILPLKNPGVPRFSFPIPYNLFTQCS